MNGSATNLASTSLTFRPVNIGFLISFLGNNSRQIVCFLLWLLPCSFIFTIPQLATGIILGLLVSLWCGFRAKLYLGGITGDVLGATAFLAELAFLLGILLLV